MAETKEFKNIESKFKSLNSLTTESNKISKDLLNSSILQNIELSQIRTQMEAANDINKLMLKKQIEEIEKKETQKFYKALSYHCSEIVEIIQKIKDSSVQYYMIAKYCDKLKAQINEASNSLEEINDKLYNKATYEKIAILKEASEINFVSFSNSILANFDILLNDIQLLQYKQSTLNISYRPIQKIKLFRPFRWLFGTFTTFGLYGVGLLLIGYELYWIHKKKSESYALSLEHEKRKAKNEKEEAELKSQIENHTFFKTLNEISSEHPEFMKVADEISSMLKNFNSRYQLA